MHRATTGARWDGAGTTFHLRSSIATAVELCLLPGAPDGDERRIEMTRSDQGNFDVRVPEVGPGARYGFRVHGPWEPSSGLRCNPSKLLLDPRALHIDGDLEPHPSLFGHDLDDESAPSTLDSAPHTLHSVVVDDRFDWQGDARPRTPFGDSVIYETHVKGISRTHPDVPQELRGTYAGLAHPAVVEHLAGLGVTAVELLPVQRFVHELHLLDTGRRNYWGYNSIGFFAPHAGYAAGDDPVGEFKEMVRTLHAAGLEVILDVVYNHTAEGNRLGPTLSFRGIDNPEWYRLDPVDGARYLNWTGTGNTLHLGNVEPLRLVMDSLRYWVEEMHVDGFRFDLATTLGRTRDSFDDYGGFFGAVAQDPVLSDVKLIAEPWDVGPGGYQVGAFPSRWSEWNDRARDTVRDFWRGTEGTMAAFATRITGSADLYEASGRPPTAGVNFVTSHDGFTLADLVSYERRHNHANGENNRDGHPDNHSWNSGVEGPTTNAEVADLRTRRRKAMLATIMLSQGVPMMLGGDEIGRTQGGNNNAYCQDNETSWYDWHDVDAGFLSFARHTIALRRDHPTFRRVAWLHEHAAPTGDHVGWYTPDGVEMSVHDWHLPHARAVGLYLDGGIVHAAGGTVSDDDFLLLFNGGHEPCSFAIPHADEDRPWSVALDAGGDVGDDVDGLGPIDVEGFGLVVLRRPRA